jgi:hypothetical protein
LLLLCCCCLSSALTLQSTVKRGASAPRKKPGREALPLCRRPERSRRRRD